MYQVRKTYGQCRHHLQWTDSNGITAETEACSVAMMCLSILSGAWDMWFSTFIQSGKLSICPTIIVDSRSKTEALHQ